MRLLFTQKKYLLQVIIGLMACFKIAYASNQPDVTLLMQRAEAMSLAKHPTWLALLHYKRESILGRVISQVDDKDFFISAEGKTNAHAELKATIRAFYKGSHSRHAQCIFPARWWWFKQQLNLNDEHDVRCPLLETYMTRIGHDKLFLVFPTMYMNNPGSMFGHTFLRFDANNKSFLFSKTLNYAADINKEDGIIKYTSKGLFGGYNGFFQLQPYYKRVQEYSNIENRDIWEYQLDFSPAEIKQLARHYWEIKGIDIDYYFLRENCSYRLLALLDVVRPNLQLTSDGGFSFYAIPVDTVKALKNKKLIKSYQLRPALETKIDNYFSNHKRQVDLILRIVNKIDFKTEKQLKGLLTDVKSKQEKINLLNQSYRLLQLKQQEKNKKAQLLLALSHDLSQAKDSEIKQTAEKIKIVKEPADDSHDSIRLAFGVGQKNNKNYVAIKLRPAFHDLLDAPKGFTDGAEINVLDLELRIDEQEKIELKYLRLFNIKSLNSVVAWKTPISWMLDFKVDQTQMSLQNSARNFINKGGIGYSFKSGYFKSYALLLGELNFSSDYEKGYSALAGLQIGLRFSLPHHQFLIELEKESAVAGFSLDNTKGQIQWQYNLSLNHAFRLQYQQIKYHFLNDEDISLVYQYYF